MTYSSRDQAACAKGIEVADSFAITLARSSLVNFHSKGSAMCSYRS
jgi:hypothetical protein